MNLIAYDFETYYDKDYSLSKITTEEYIRNPLFETIGIAVQVNRDPVQWFSGTKEDTLSWLRRFDWANSMAVAHNAVFDAAILNWHFGIQPKHIADTLSMARAVHGTEVGGSLKVLAEHYQLGVKGTEVIAALGKRREDFSVEGLERYGEYCKNDVTLTFDLFLCLSEAFNKSEMRLIDLTIRMFTEPKLVLHSIDLIAHLNNIKERKVRLLSTLRFSKEDLMSNDRLAAVLTHMGVEPPTKISPTTGKETYAFAKTDEEFKALLDHEDPLVQMTVAARLGVKSTLEETRTQRFIDLSGRGLMPVPLRYYAAHTGRWGGDDKINLQNLPRLSPLKKAILAPPGYMIIDSDSSQIEARTLAWFAEQDDLISAFAAGQDVYRIMASSIYNKEESLVDKGERFVGKTTILGCLAGGSMVLCEKGWKPIEQVSISDKLWDGEEWVCHQGLVRKGLKETLSLSGLWLTPDHKVLCGTQWLEAQSVVADENTLCLALGTGAENLPSQVICGANEGVSQPLLSNAVAEETSTPLTNKILKTLKVRGAIFALENQLRKLVSCIGGTQIYCQTMSIENGYSIDCLLPSAGATLLPANSTSIMGVGASKCLSNGEKIVAYFFATCKRLWGGISPHLKWIGLMSTRGMNPETLGLYQRVKICGTSAVSKPLKKLLPTYDLAFSGPRNRYTVLTEQGPIIVHNCGYGMGWRKFQAQLNNFMVTISDIEAERVINVYRETYPKIKELWAMAQKAIVAMESNKTCDLGRAGVIEIYGKKGIKLPNGLFLKYPNLRKMVNDEGQYEYVYDTKRGKQVTATKIYGGKLVENICQALARCIIGEQLVNIADKYKVVLTVHDAIACLVPEYEVLTAQVDIENQMRIAPAWAVGLPLNCESGTGTSYGDC